MIVVTTRARAHQEVPKPYVAVPIDRSTPLGNPFKIGPHGTREKVVELYEFRLEAVIHGALSRPDFRQALTALVELARENGNIALICHCAPEPCHGDVLKRYLDQLIGESL
jgi:hypothetical protein